MGIFGIGFVCTFAALLVMALVKHPRYGMYAYLAAFYVHPPSRWWGAVLPNFRWALLAGAVTLIAVWKMPKNAQQPSWISTTPGKLLVAFTVVVWIQNAWALDPEKNLEFSVLFTKYIILFYVIYRICGTREEVQKLLLVHVAGCFYLGYLAFNEGSSGRLEGVGGPGIDEANALGMQLATAVVCGAMTVLVERRWRLLAFVVVAMAFVLNGIVLTGSRGAFLSLICGGFCLIVLKPPEHTKLFWSLAALAAVLFLMVANQSFWSRIGTMGAAVDDSREMDTSAESRFVVAEAQVRMALSYPHGTGHRGTASLSRQYLEEKYLSRLSNGERGERSSHNSFLSAWVEEGIPGAAIFIMFLAWCYRAIHQLKLRYAQGRTALERGNLASIAAALTVVFVAGLFVDYIQAEVQIWFIGMLAALLVMGDAPTQETAKAKPANSRLARRPGVPSSRLPTGRR